MKIRAISDNSEHISFFKKEGGEQKLLVRALPIRPCRRAAWQTLVATINLFSGSVTFLPEGVDLGLWKQILVHF